MALVHNVSPPFMLVVALVRNVSPPFMLVVVLVRNVSPHPKKMDGVT